MNEFSMFVYVRRKHSARIAKRFETAQSVESIWDISQKHIRLASSPLDEQLNEVYSKQ